MNKLARFIIWICSKFTKHEIEEIINGLLDVIQNRNPEVKPKDDFKEKHPNYRKFSVPPLAPLTQPAQPEKAIPKKDFKDLLAQYEQIHGKPLVPVKCRSGSTPVPDRVLCPCCNAPHIYLYYNDGKKRSQILCKVCSYLFQMERRFRKGKKTKYYCPYCQHALYQWKQKKECTIYKCPNHNCSYRIGEFNKLNTLEKNLRKLRLSQFKLSYQFREFHYKLDNLSHSSPHKPAIDLSKIHNSTNVLGLILAFYVSFALSARKTAMVLKSVFSLNVSYQTVLNYASAASFYCHSFNLANKGDIDLFSAGDETYIKIMGKHHFVFFFISSKNLKITSYHLADSRDTLPAIIAINEAIRTAKKDQIPIIVSDANPSYQAAIHFLNSHRIKIHHKKVIGIQNLDDESGAYRPYKQLVERLNRTFKHHVKPAHGFNSANGAFALISLFVTYYNFLRPHMSLNNKPPVIIPELADISTIQGKWAKILSLAA